jgi:hypothetical protein
VSAPANTGQSVRDPLQIASRYLMATAALPPGLRMVRYLAGTRSGLVGLTHV